MTTPYPFVAGNILTAQQLNDIQNLPISDKTVSYVLTVADAYKRTMMNSASATTITVNNSIFTVGDVIQVANKGAGTCTITAGVGVTINTSGSLALAQYGGGYLLCLSASTFTFFNLGGVSYGIATGGSSSSITVGGVNYTLLTFTSDGTLTVSKAGLFDIGAVGAGAGGGRTGGGGGGGQVILGAQVYLPATTHIVDIGAGGAASPSDWFPGYNGFATYLNGYVYAQGGGGGGTNTQGNGSGFGVGGGNGGGGYYNTAGGSSLAGGYSGGTGGTNGGGGGGGAGGAGATSVGTTGGAGGAGVETNGFIGGASTFKGGGGGGRGDVAGGAGGSGGGSAGNQSTAGAANSGGGGGGNFLSPAAGGSGILYVRFKS